MAQGSISSVFRSLGSESESPAQPPADAEQARSALASLTGSEPTSFISGLASAGIVANRWTSPDLAAQLNDLARHPVNVVLCGALDLDPALPLQQAICREHALEACAGVAALAKIAGAARAIVALAEDSPADVVSAMRQAAQVTGIRLYPTRSEYPVGHASLLIRRILGRRVKPGRLPAEAQVLFIDAAAVLAVGRFVLFQEAMRTVPFALYEQQRRRSHLLRVVVGTRLSEVLAALDVPASESELRAGHFLREVAIAADMVIGGGELTAIASAASQHDLAAACIRCAWCVEACPAHIHPAGLLEAAQQQDLELGDRYGLASCIECGICSYVCPSQLPLLQSIRQLRNS